MKTLTRIEACQVLLYGGKLEYSQINSDYWSDVTNRDLVFTLDDNYIFRETPEYEFIQYTLDELAAHLKTFGRTDVWVFDGEYYEKDSVIESSKDNIAIRAFRGDKFYKRVEAE